MKKPELTPTSEKIDRILSRIDSGDIRIPAFQRGFVWKQEQIIALLDSIFTNYPIGSILLWNTSERLNFTRNIAGYLIPDTAIEYPVNYILDGQQRISTIYAVFSNKTEQDRNSEVYNPDLDLFDIYYDFEKDLFLPKNEVNQKSDHIVFLRNLLDAGELIDLMSSLNEKYRPQAKILYSKFINYEIPVVTIKNREKEEVGIIFERINNTGTKLGTLDLMTAWTWTENFHLLESINEFLEELDEKGFGELSHNIVLQTISGITQNDTSTKSILRLSGDKVRDEWGNICEAIKKAIDFLSTDLKCSNLDFVPFHQQIVVLSKFFSTSNRYSATELEKLKVWFWNTSFSNRYSTGQTTFKMNGDIETVLGIQKQDFSLLDTYEYTVTNSQLIDTKFSKANSLTRAFLLLMAQSEPIDLVKNVSIDLGASLSKYNRKEFHHVFPNSFLKKQGHSSKKIFSIMNFCFLPADSNKHISKRSPSDYFVNLIPQDHLNGILDSNLIPIKKDIYSNDDFNAFLERRAEIVITKIEKLTN